VDPARLHELLTEMLFACPIYKNYGRQILAGQFQQPLFRLALGLKDLGLVSQLAFDSRTPMPLGSLLRDRYTSAAAHGHGDWDWTAIVAEVEADAGLAR
jgi:3-hydroxyisobutyrate dehydrogenase-like beta-hydroxyacid dehydrogenase